MGNGALPHGPSYRAHPRLAHRDVSLRCTDWVAIGGIADMPRASRAGRFGENDPTWTFEFGVPLLRCSGSLTLHQDTEGPHVLSSDFAVHAEPEEFRDLSRQGSAACGRPEVRRRRAHDQPPRA